MYSTAGMLCLEELIMQEYERKYSRLTKCTDENRSRLDPVKGMKVPAFQ